MDSGELGIVWGWGVGGETVPNRLQGNATKKEGGLN